MTDHPIIMSAESVCAIMAGTKTQTRRLVKWPRCASLHGRWPLPERSHADRDGMIVGPYLHAAYTGGDLGGDVLSERVAQPWAVGDRLWVRETWEHLGDNSNPPLYRADATEGDLAFMRESGSRWRSPIHMPRWASRLTLEVSSVRVQRVQEISTEDVLAEGIGHGRVCPWLEFKDAWDSINSKRAPWATNPWVWAVMFRRATA